MNNIKIGDLVKHEYRKTAIYQVLSINGEEVKMKRAAKSKGWALQGKNYITDLSLLTYFGEGNPFGEFTESVSSTPREELTIAELKRQPFLYEDWVVAGFESMCGQLSPENLSCDGELSPSLTHRRKEDVLRRWSLLEKLIEVNVKQEF